MELKICFLLLFQEYWYLLRFAAAVKTSVSIPVQAKASAELELFKLVSRAKHAFRSKFLSVCDPARAHK